MLLSIPRLIIRINIHRQSDISTLCTQFSNFSSSGNYKSIFEYFSSVLSKLKFNHALYYV